MSIEQAIYNHIKSVVPQTYRIKAPTDATDYVVIDFITDTTAYNKDINVDIRPGNKVHLQAKSYSNDQSVAKSMINTIEQCIRTIHNDHYDGVILKSAYDTGTMPGYSPIPERFTYLIDIYIYTKQLS